MPRAPSVKADSAALSVAPGASADARATLYVGPTLQDQLAATAPTARTGGSATQSPATGAAGAGAAKKRRILATEPRSPSGAMPPKRRGNLKPVS